MINVIPFPFSIADIKRCIFSSGKLFLKIADISKDVFSVLQYLPEVYVLLIYIYYIYCIKQLYLTMCFNIFLLSI